jgi:O-antigen/teichoic acid export membrane protein
LAASTSSKVAMIDRPSTARSIRWSLVDSVTQVLLSLAFLVCLMRYLSPADFGIAALGMTIVALFSSLLENVFSDAIAQRQELDPLHIDTAFSVTLIASLIVLVGCWASAPLLGQLFGDARLASIFVAASPSIPLLGAAGILGAVMRRSLRFKALAARTSIGRTLGTAVGIAGALSGFGAWSMVAQQVVSAFASLVVILWLSPVWPRFRFSPAHFRQLVPFAAASLSMQVIWLVNPRIFLGYVGYYLGPADLGYVACSLRIVDAVNAPVVIAASNASVPIFARSQGDMGEYRTLVTKATEYSCILSWFALGSLLLLADIGIDIVLGADWQPAAPVLRCFCVLAMAQFMTLYWGVALTAAGCPHYNVLWYGLCLALTIVGSSLLVPDGLIPAALAWVIQFVATIPLAAMIVKRTIGIPMIQHVASVLPALLASGAMLATTLGIKMLLPPPLSLSTMAGLALLGAAIYALVIALVRPQLSARLVTLARTSLAARQA